MLAADWLLTDRAVRTERIPHARPRAAPATTAFASPRACG